MHSLLVARGRLGIGASGGSFALCLAGGAECAGTAFCIAAVGLNSGTLCGPGLGLGFGAGFGFLHVSWVSLVSIRFGNRCMLSLMRFASPEGFLPNTSWLSYVTSTSGVPSLIKIRKKVSDHFYSEYLYLCVIGVIPRSLWENIVRWPLS